MAPLRPTRFAGHSWLSPLSRLSRGSLLCFIGLAQTPPLAVMGTWAHETPDGALRLTLRPDATFTLSQSGLPDLDGDAKLEGGGTGPWDLQLRAASDTTPSPSYTLRCLDAAHLGLSGGALVFEVVLERR